MTLRVYAEGVTVVFINDIVSEEGRGGGYALHDVRSLIEMIKKNVYK